MPDKADKILRQFTLSGLPSLPELLLQELDALQTCPEVPGQDTGLADLAQSDVFLSARLLALVPAADGGKLQPAWIGRQVGRNTLASIIRQSAARMSFARFSPQRLRFLKQLYLQSILAKPLAEELARQVLPDSAEKPTLLAQAGFCGLFLNVGALVLEQVFGSRYLELLQQSSDTRALIDAEIATFGADHAQVGAAFMTRWQVDGFCRDAVRYHHHDINELLDATVLVKIAWLANQLANEKEHPEAGVWAQTLFELDQEALVQVRQAAVSTLNTTSKAASVTFTTTRYLPLPDVEDEQVMKQKRRAFKLLRDRMETENLLAAIRGEFSEATTAPGQGQALAAAINLLFGPYQALVFVPDDEPDTGPGYKGTTLRCATGTTPETTWSQLQVRCDTEGSPVVTSFLAGKPLWKPEEDALQVIDRQLLSLLQSNNYCCEPIRQPGREKPCALLVTGIPAQHVEAYRKQEALRQALAAEFSVWFKDTADANSSQQESLADAYRQRISDTIHEVNNPLGIIKNYLQLLSMKQNDDSKVQSEISFIKSEIDRVSGILEKLRDKPGTDDDKSVNINAVVTSLSDMFRGAIADDKPLTIETQLEAGLPALQCNENSVRQILTNLVKNATEACEEGGRIQLKTAGNVYMNSSCYIQLTVTDDGPGIAANILENLFAPGNSSKGGDHTGSGLAIVKALIAELGGQISCQTSSRPASSPSQQLTAGTIFTVLLPVTSNSGDDA